MDPWLKALQLHRQRKKERIKDKSFDQEIVWKNNDYEHYDGDYRKTSSRIHGNTIERPSLDDETGVFAFENKDYKRKRRKQVEGSYEETLLESQGSRHLSNENGKRARNRPDNPEKNSFPQEEARKTSEFAEDNSSVALNDSGEPFKTSTRCNSNDSWVSASLEATVKDSANTGKVSAAEEQQKLLEELRRIEEELEKARAGTIS